MEVGRGLVSNLELEAVLNGLVEVGRELTGARYAALGIPELWQFDGDAMQVLKLAQDGLYTPNKTSLAFRFLPMQKFSTPMVKMTASTRKPPRRIVVRAYRAMFGCVLIAAAWSRPDFAT